MHCEKWNRTSELEIFSQFDQSILYQIIHLDLSDNSIDEIAPGYFQKVPNLRYLDLSGNNLETLVSDVFKGLNHLEQLHLERTNLEIQTSLPPGLFQHTPSLKYLNLKCPKTQNWNNLIRVPLTTKESNSDVKFKVKSNQKNSESTPYLEPTFPDDVFIDLKNIEYLGLSLLNVGELSFGNAFTDMKFLTFLDFYQGGESESKCGDYLPINGFTYMYDLTGSQFGRSDTSGFHHNAASEDISHHTLHTQINKPPTVPNQNSVNYNNTDANNAHNASAYKYVHPDNSHNQLESFNTDGLHLRNDTFLPFKDGQLKKLNLKHAKIRGVDACVWCPLKSLEILDISCNEFPSSFAKWTDSFYGLQGNSIQTIMMDNIVDPDNIEKWSFDEDKFRFLKNTRIHQISMAGNAINEISPILGSVFPYLEYLSLKANFIWNVYGETRDLVLLDLFTSNLKVLDLSYMMNAGGNTVKCWVPSELWLKNFIEDTDNPRPRCESEGALEEYLRYKAEHPEQNVAAFPLPFNIEEIYGNNLPFYSTTGQAISYTPIFILNNNHLRRISAEGVSLQQLRHDFLGAKCLEYINVRDNKISFIKPDILRNQPYLRTILLGDNQLGQQLSKGGNDSTLFENVTSLQVIDISSNSIPSLNKSTFRGLHNLRVLNISRNYQFGKSGLDLDVQDLRKLVYFDLSYTSTTSFDMVTRNFFDDVNKHEQLSIDLTGNGFPCGCQNQEMINWMQNSSIHFPNKQTYMCDNNNTYIMEVNISKLATDCFQAPIEVKHNALVQTILLSLGSVLFLVILGAVVYRYRWKLRYHFYLAKGSLRDHGDPKVQDGFKYDAFVAYNHSEDYHWIIDELIPEIETKHNLSLLIGQRDFTAGNLIIDNIVDAIENSRKTILVLTPSFADSTWCNWEMKFALSKGEGYVIPIMQRHIPQEVMPKTLMRIISTMTYLEWSDDEDAKPLFWKKLLDKIAVRK
ncbi:unnamed protein product [Owenia fusiformis]|uniref:TIR domain-containing protein n=1 Tax=Owenia fusiformis TaxID=6347 RepID=A0A8S4PEP0_OWEFU|nr:unnamed protein product [Owenia fusiformis]